MEKEDEYDNAVGKVNKSLTETLTPVIKEQTDEINKKIDKLESVTTDQIKDIVTGVFEKNPATVTHHDPEDAENCPNCKPKLERIINRAKDESHQHGYELGQAANKLLNLQTKVNNRWGKKK
tara:strand:+ start:900 stop:1265 length:366 start_codon:yes stop_codon:yes gene_type:complete